MAFDDDKIRIQVDGAQAAAQLDALAGEVQALEKELEDLNNTAGVTNAEIEGTTRRLGEARAKFAEQAEAVREAKKAQDDTGESTKSLADKYLSLGVKVFGARQVLMAAGEAMRSVAQATGNYSGATKDAIDQTDNLLKSIASLDLIGASKALGQLSGQTLAWAQGLNEVNVELGNLADKNAADEFRKILAAQGALVQSHEKEVAALNLKAEALSREIATQQQAGEVQKFIRDAVEETLKAYEKAGEVVPAKLAEQAAALGITTDAQDKAAASAAKLEEAGVKAAEKRAAAEEKAAEAIIQALARETAALDAKLAQDEARLQKALDKGGKIDTSGDADAAKAEVEGLKSEIQKLENQPLLNPDELNKLNELKDRAGQAAAATRDLGRVFTITRDDFLTEAEAADAASAAWDVYGDMLDKAQARHDAVMNGIDGAADSFGGFEDAAESAGGALEDVADAAGSIGDEAKKGVDKAKEGLDKLNEGADEAIPKLETIKSLLAEIKQAAAEVDL